MKIPILIVSPNGDPHNTQVTLVDGTTVPGVAAISVEIRPGQVNTAKLEFCAVAIGESYAVADLTEFIATAAGRMSKDERTRLISEIKSLPPAP